jgi:hypothetical protein
VPSNFCIILRKFKNLCLEFPQKRPHILFVEFTFTPKTTHPAKSPLTMTTQLQNTPRASYSAKHYKAAAALLAALAAASSASAATISWGGGTDNDFMNGANWASTPALPSLSLDTWQINGPGSQGNSTLNVSAPLTFTGTAGKIAFGAASGSMTLSGSPITFFQGVSGDALLTASAGTTEIASNLILGDGSARTYNFGSTSTTTGLLHISGNITGGTGGTGGINIVSFSSTDAQDGNYLVSGNITRGATATALSVLKRGSGTLTLTGTNVVSTLATNNAAANDSVIRINGGTTNILNAANTGWGGQNVLDSKIQVSSGTLNAFDARSVRNSIQVDGGTLNIGQANNENGDPQSNTTGGARLSFNSANTTTAYTFDISAGSVNFLPSYTAGNTNFGVRIGSDNGAATATAGANVTATQSGGTFTVNGAGGQHSTFSLGTAEIGKTNSYALSGGTLDIRGSNSTNGHLTIGAAGDGSGTSTFTLSGTGKLIVRSTAAGGQGINGSNAGGVQNFDFNGGTLVAGEITTALLRRTGDSSNGVFTQAGGVFAAGDVGFTGRSTITGTYVQTAGTMSFDLGGTTASSSFQDVGDGFFDNVVIEGGSTLNSLGGNLELNLVHGFENTIQVGNSFRIIDVLSTGSVSGSFVNAASTYELTQFGNIYTFGVNYAGGTGNDVVLTLNSVSVIPEPSAFAALAGLGALGLASLRRRRRA